VYEPLCRVVLASQEHRRSILTLRQSSCTAWTVARFARKMVLASMEKEMELEVICYSGRKADERPVRFRLDKRDYTVEEVLDQWYGPDDAFYKVRAQDGNVYVLRRQMSAGSWHLVAFRQST
jgi:hypothetical protein